MPDFLHEIEAGRHTGKVICGVDEVGRGPLAGPVIAAALILPHDFPENLLAQIRDSKKMTAVARERLYDPLIDLCPHAIAEANVEEIDRLNILWASMLAMQRAVEGLESQLNNLRPPPPSPGPRGAGEDCGTAASKLTTTGELHLGGMTEVRGGNSPAPRGPGEGGGGFSKIAIALIDGNRAPKLSCATQTIIKGDDKSYSIAAASIIAKVHRDRLMKKLAEEFPHYGWESNAGYGTAQHIAGLTTHGVTRWHRTSFAPIRAVVESAV